jgi:hypothetical protein
MCLLKRRKMSFDINTVLGDMVDSVKGIVADDAGKIGGYAKTIMENEKESLEELAKARLFGEISEDELKEEIEREKMVVEAELLTLEIMTKATAQRAVNAAMEIFVKAIKVALV